MVNLPEVGLNAVIDNLAKFQKGADSIEKAYDDINAGADSVGDATGAAAGALTGLGGVATTVATGGMALLAAAVAAVTAAAAAAVAGIGLLAKASFDLASEVEASQKKIQSQLGVTEEEAEKLGETARDVWANNFAGSIEEATIALVEVRKQLKGISDEELQDATENAIRLSDAFGIDITESTNAANVLMKQFGLSQQEAFDFITKGFQDGLNSSDDFLDSVSEYGGLFGQAGGDAGQFFSLLETGLQGGVLGTDKAADAFKEFNIRFQEGGVDLKDAFQQLGIDPWEDWIEAVSDGRTTVSATFSSMLEEIQGIEDPIERNRIGIALFGTQFEDLGGEAVAAIDLAKTSLDDLGGATETLNAQYNTLPQAFEGVKRQLLVAIQPIGDALLEAANTVMPMLLDAIEDMKPALEDFAVLLGDFITKAIQDLIPWIQKKLIPALKDMWKFIKKNVLPIIEDLWDLFGESKKQSKTVQKAFEKMMDVIEPFIKKTMANLLEIWEIMKKWVDKNWPLIQKTIAVVMFKIKSSIDKVTKAIQKIWDKWGDEIMAVVDFVFNTVFKIVKTGIEDVLDIITAVMKIITGDWEGAWETIKDIIDRHMKLVKDIAEDGIELVKKVIKKVMSEIQTFLRDKWNDIKTDLTDKMTEIKEAINTKWTEIKTSVVTKVMEMIQGIKDTIRNAAGIGQALIDKIKEALNELSSAITGGSIFQKLSEIGRKIASGIISGFTAVKDFVANMAGKLGEWLSSVVSLVGNAGSFIGKIIKDIGTKIVSTIINGISNFVGFIELVKAKIAGWIATIVTKLGSIATTAKALGTKIINNIMDGISSMATEFKEWLKKKFEEWLSGIFSNNASFSLSGTSNFSTPSQVSGPALGATSSVNTTNNFNIGGNNIASNMDAAVFEARVLQVIRQNL